MALPPRRPRLLLALLPPLAVGALLHARSHLKLRRTLASTAAELAAARAREGELREDQALRREAAIVFDNTAEAVVVTDAQANIVRVNKAYTAVTGYRPEEVMGKNPRIHQSGRHDRAFYERMWDSLMRTGQWQGEIWNRRKNGEIYPAWENISVVRDESGRTIHYVALLSDITTMKQAEERLTHLAHHDPLTGLPNRLFFRAGVEQSLERARRNRERRALLFIDLDRFKEINDSLGHGAGDALLQEVAKRLRERIRGEDLAARLGGDEFTVMLEQLHDPNDAGQLAAELIGEISAPVTLDGVQLSVSASIGIALFPDDADDADELIRAADEAMYRAKAGGRNAFEYYSPPRARLRRVEPVEASRQRQ